MSLANETPVVFNTLAVHTEGGVLFAAIASPPMNLLGPELVWNLVSLIRLAEGDDTLKVVVFKSADPDYFISHVDLTRVSEYRGSRRAHGRSIDRKLLFRYVSACRLVTIAQIEGRVAGAGVSLCWHATCASPRETKPSLVNSSPRSDRFLAGAPPVPHSADGSRPSARGPADRG